MTSIPNRPTDEPAAPVARGVPTARRRRLLLLALFAFGATLLGRVVWILPSFPEPASAQAPTNTVQVFIDPARDWKAYLNVYDGPKPDGHGVAAQEVNAGFSGETAFMGPVRSYPWNRPPQDTDWWSPDGKGKKWVQSLLQVIDDSLAGKTVVFSGYCLSNGLPKTLNYQPRAVISEFSPDYSQGRHVTLPLRPGKSFRLSLKTRLGNHIKYGFELVGPNLDTDRFGPVGKVWMTAQTPPESPPEPEPAHFENPSFELPASGYSPGYVVDNGGSIPGWTTSAPEITGLDVQGGWFANNGSVPNGKRVAFIRTRNGEAKTISTVITGLDPGKAYRVGFRANSRENGAETGAQWSLNGGDFHPFRSWPPVGGSNPFRMISGGFLATAPTAPLVIRNQSPSDSVLLVDDFFVVFVPGIEMDMSQRTSPDPGVSSPQ